MIDKLIGKPEPPYVFEGVKPGDRFKPTTTFDHALHGVITVTELCAEGFKYTVQTPYHAFPARWGPSLVEGGIMCINDPAHSHSLWNSLYEKVL